MQVIDNHSKLSWTSSRILLGECVKTIFQECVFQHPSQGSRYQDEVRSTKDLLRVTSVKCEELRESLQTMMQIWKQWVEKRKKDCAGSDSDCGAALRKSQSGNGELQCKEGSLRSPTLSRKAQVLVRPWRSDTGERSPRIAWPPLRFLSK